MNNTNLHIVSFNVPYPPNYGGIIDVYYKVKYLHQLGIKIHLHCYEYGREHAPELEELCAQVSYYKRNMHLRNLLSKTPFIVKSRVSKQLIDNLLKDDAPILIEGLHCCSILQDERIRKKKVIVRAHNIEHDYYRHLAKAESNFINKLFFYWEASKLQKFESYLYMADHILAISKADYHYFKRRYGLTSLIPAFHSEEKIAIKEGRGDYVLIHGNLSVKENIAAVLHLAQHVLGHVKHQVIIAGKDPAKEVVKVCEGLSNITLIDTPSSGEMEHLIEHAQVIMLHTFQPTGLKLKLLNSLYRGRQCISNTLMVKGTGLEMLCHIADSPKEQIAAINHWMQVPITEDCIAEREHILLDVFNNRLNAVKIEKLIK